MNRLLLIILCCTLASCASQQTLVHETDEFNKSDKCKVQNNWVSHNLPGRVSFSLMRVLIENKPRYELKIEAYDPAHLFLMRGSRALIFAKDKNGKESRISLDPLVENIEVYRDNKPHYKSLHYPLTKQEVQLILDSEAISFKLEMTNGVIFLGVLTPENITNLQTFKKQCMFSN